MNIKKTLDKLLGTAVIPPLLASKLSKKGMEEIRPRKILILRLFGMGDAVLVTSLISNLKKRHKTISVSVLATNETRRIFEMSEADEVYNLDISPAHIVQSFFGTIIELRKKGFDAVIDTEQFANFSSIISYLIRPGLSIGFDKRPRSQLYDTAVRFEADKHTLFAFSDLFTAAGIKLKVRYLEPLKLSKSDERYTSRYLKRKGIGGEERLVGIHPGTGDTATFRRWMPERFAAVADHLAQKYGARIILTGTKSEEKLLHLISSKMLTKPIIATDLSLPQFAALTRYFKVFISNDTGPMHIAAAMGTPTVGLFGPNTPVRWAPLNRKSRSIYKNLPCSPCINTHLGIVPEKCPLYDSVKCMEAITIDEVERTIEKVVARIRKDKKTRRGGMIT